MNLYMCQLLSSVCVVLVLTALTRDPCSDVLSVNYFILIVNKLQVVHTGRSAWVGKVEWTASHWLHSSISIQWKYRGWISYSLLTMIQSCQVSYCKRRSREEAIVSCCASSIQDIFTFCCEKSISRQKCVIYHDKY